MKLDAVLAEFEDSDPADALAMLVEFADQLPERDVDPTTGAIPAEDCRVQECQTPVHLWVEFPDGRAHISAHVPEKSPTVRGYVALLATGLEGATRAEILSVPDDLLSRLHLAETLGMTRSRGFRGILAYLKRRAKSGDLG